MTFQTRQTELLVLQDHEGNSTKEDTHVMSNKILLSTDVPSPTCVSFMSTAKRTTTDAGAVISPRPLTISTTGFAEMQDEDSPVRANKKQRITTNESFSWFMKPTHQEISKMIFQENEVPREEETCHSSMIPSDALPHELSLPSLLKPDKEDFPKLQCTIRDRRIRPRPRHLAPAICSMKEHNNRFHQKTTKAIQQCLFDLDELCQVLPSRSSSRASSYRREVSSQKTKSFVMPPTLEAASF